MRGISRPYPARLTAAALAAGLAGAGLWGSPVAEPSGTGAPPVAVTANPVPAAVVTDLLGSFGSLVQGLSGATVTAADALLSFPFDAAQIALIGATQPALVPNLLSWLAQFYLNPALSGAPAQALRDDTARAAAQLPFVGPVLADLITRTADEFGAALAGMLPAYYPALGPLAGLWNSDLGRIIEAANLALTGPVRALGTTVAYLGHLPADLAAVTVAALADPALTPGLLSWLAWGLLGNSGPVAMATRHLLSPVLALPGVGGVVSGHLQDLQQGVVRMLEQLPTPIDPYPAGPAAARDSRPGSASASATGTAAAVRPEPGGGTDETIRSEHTGDAAAAGAGAGMAPPAEDADDTSPRRSIRTAKVKPAKKFAPELTGAEPNAGGGPVGGADEGGEKRIPATDSGSVAADPAPVAGRQPGGPGRIGASRMG